MCPLLCVIICEMIHTFACLRGSSEHRREEGCPDAREYFSVRSRDVSSEIKITIRLDLGRHSVEERVLEKLRPRRLIVFACLLFLHYVLKFGD